MTIVLAIFGMLSVDLKVIFIPGKYEKTVEIYYLIVIYYFVIKMILNTIIELSDIIFMSNYITYYINIRKRNTNKDFNKTKV